MRFHAGVAEAQTAAAIHASFRPCVTYPKLSSDLDRFGLEGSRPRVEIDKAAGAVNLRCISRAIAQAPDAPLKDLDAAKSGLLQSSVPARLDHILKDDALIAPVAGRQLAGDQAVAIPTDVPMSSCARSARQAIQRGVGARRRVLPRIPRRTQPGMEGGVAWPFAFRRHPGRNKTETCRGVVD
jgi:hypothetical protein